MQLIGPIFDDIHKLSGENQTHGGDLLLVHQNGSFREDILQFNNVKTKLSPYTIGFGETGHSAKTPFKRKIMQKHLFSVKCCIKQGFTLKIGQTAWFIIINLLKLELIVIILHKLRIKVILLKGYLGK